MIVQITGKVAIGLCDWIYNDVRNGLYDRTRFTKLLTMSMKYNTNDNKDSKRWVYIPDEQRLKFYNGLYVEKEVWFKKQLAF